MGAFVLIRRSSSEQSASILASAADEMRKQGFGKPTHFSDPFYDLLLYPKLVTGTVNVVTEDRDFCASSGTFVYNGKIGELALREFSAVFDEDNFAEERAMGSYCIIIRKQGRTRLFIDPLGLYKVYCNEERTIVSSSFLAVLGQTPHAKVNEQCLYEYVFTGATFGNETIIQQIRLIDGHHYLRIGRNCTVKSRKNSRMPIQQTASVSNIDYQLNVLRRVLQDTVSAANGKIDTALSGGYDSRLILALLLEQGITPRLHVYGKPSDADVKVAKAVSDEMGLELLHIDKSAKPGPATSEFVAIVRRNLLAFDGCPPDGVFNNGADMESRVERCADDYLMLNGGGGEIYRNFFYLPDKRLTIGEFVISIYSQFDERCCTGRFSANSYFSALGDKIKSDLNKTSAVLERREIEWLYPTFRCRYWMAKNNSVNNRLGNALTPFVELAPVSAALDIPLTEKNFGRFEGRMISAVSPILASLPSAYGHNFVGEPPLRRKIQEMMSLARPTWIRKRTYKIRTQRLPAATVGLMSSSYLEPIIGNDFSYMRRFFKVSEIRDSGQLNRVCTLELLFQEYGISI